MLLRVRAPQNCHNPNPPFGFCWDFPTVGSGMHRAPVKACQWKQTGLGRRYGSHQAAFSGWSDYYQIVVLLQMDWPGSASMPEQGTLTSMVSGSPVDLHPNSLSYPDARMESYKADSGRSAHPTRAPHPRHGCSRPTPMPESPSEQRDAGLYKSASGPRS